MTTFKYNDAGERVIKSGDQGEMAYVNQFWSVRNSTEKTKHVFVGSSRLASRIIPGSGNDSPVFFYHADHLGSTSFVTDEEGELYEHAQYFPFGEQWVLQQGSQDLPYLFTSKELDEETGLYYFGARYYDPRTSVWQSPDPALPEYLALQVQPPSAPLEGVARPVNLALYSYCHLRPLIMRDPDGRDPVRIVPGQKCEVAECEVVYFIPLPDGTTVVQSVGVIARGATAVASSAWAWVAATPLGLKAKDIVDRVAPRWPRPT